MTNIFSNSAEKKFLSVHEEEEKLQMTDGMCSRDWGLIYKIPRIASAFTLEQTLLFTFDKDTFIKYFNVS